MKPTIYTTPNCTYCNALKSFLTSLNVEYDVVDVSVDSEARKSILNLTQQMGVPVLVLDGKFLVGFNEEKVKEFLAL